MPGSTGPGCGTSAPAVPSALMRYTRSALGLLNATSAYSDGMSVDMWIGRVGSTTGSPCGDSAPLAGSMRNAFRWCFCPAAPMPDAPSLVATYRNRRDACGQAYCTLAGRMTEPRRVSVPASTSTS